MDNTLGSQILMVPPKKYLYIFGDLKYPRKVNICDFDI